MKRALLLVLILIALSLITLNPASSSTTIPTQAYINVTPNPVGVGQTVTINLWLNEPPPTANGTYGDRWQNLTIGFVNPVGQKMKLGPFSSDEAGRVVKSFTVDQVGKYSLWSTFGGQTLAGVNLAPGTTSEFIGDYYQPSVSNIFELTVQLAHVDLTATSTPTSIPTASPTLTPTPTPTSTPTATLTPTPTPSSKIVPATTDTGVVVDLAIGGNVTSSQMSNVTISTNQTAASTTLSFTLTGESGTICFSNITIAKSNVPYGTTPTVTIDNQRAINQGCTQDNANYYVWYTTSFSTHQVSVAFMAASFSPSSIPSNQLEIPPIEVIYGVILGLAVTATVIAIVSAIIMVKKK